ncbi:MAG: hypothetical protein WC541_10225 [Dehalococcoidia bacterium]
MYNRKPRFAVLREDLFAITGDQLMALILDRLLYDTYKDDDFEAFYDEGLREGRFPGIEPTHGWLHKTACDIYCECMANSIDSVRSRLNKMVSKGLLMRRKHSVINMDRSYDYRVSIGTVIKRLDDIGYTLDISNYVKEDDKIERLPSCR